VGGWIAINRWRCYQKHRYAYRIKRPLGS
jgi:hypothetical protein